MIKRITTEPEGENWFWEWIEEYSQFFRDDNWYTYHLCWIEFENDKMMGGYEITFIVLGIGFRWRWNHTETETMKYCKDAVKDILKDE